MKNLYDELLKSIKSCVRPVPFQKLADHKRIIAVAVNEEGIIKEFLHRLFALSDTVEIIFIAQPKMAGYLKNIANEAIHVVEWQGAYTDRVAEFVRAQQGEAGWDVFLYFCDQPVNLRNTNILHLAEAICPQREYGIYGIDIEGTLYEYQNIALYNQGIRVYEDANTLIAMSNEAVRNKDGGSK